MNSPSPFPQVFDAIGLGFGPANLALSGALLECGSPYKKICFIEKHDKFRWHPGMLLPGTRMQISWIKDLATLRNPQSPMTFLNYLHSEGRLLSFINLGSPIPSRKEFTDYLTWAANYVQSKGVSVYFGEQVIAIPKGPDGTVDVVSRNLKTGEHITRRTKNLIVSPGGSPRMPPAVSMASPHLKIIHSSTYSSSIHSILSSIASSRTASAQLPVKIAVVGGGQSGVEVTIDLRSKLVDLLPLPPNEDGTPARHEIDLIVSGGSLKPSDDSPSSNEIFDPASTDMMFNLKTKTARDTVIKEFKATNYGVVNPRTIDNLYELLYEQEVDDSIAKRAKLGGEEKTHRQTVSPRIAIRNYSTLVAAELVQAPISAGGNSGGDTFLITLQNRLTKKLRGLEYDAIVCATGYDRSSWFQLLRRSELGKHFVHGDPSSHGPLHVLPDHAKKSDSVASLPSDFQADAPGMTDSSASSSVDTPPTSAGPSSPILDGGPDITRDPPSKVYVTRAYQLVPKDAGAESLPRVYIQGCTESTHGLSDTLLSVVSVKAGEIADDLMRG